MTVQPSRQLHCAPCAGPFGLEVTTSADGSVDLRLVLRARLDRELQDTYLLTVVAVDGGTPPRSGSMAVQVQVSDANDNSPVFSQDDYEVRARSTAARGLSCERGGKCDPICAITFSASSAPATKTIPRPFSLASISVWILLCDVNSSVHQG